MRGRDLDRLPGTASGVQGYVVVDVETTGLRTSDRIVEFAAELLDVDGLVVGRYTTLIKPGRRASVGRHIHGVSTAMLEGAPCFEEVAGDVVRLLCDRVVVAHHLAFDWGHLRDELRRVGVDAPATVPGICTAGLARAAGGGSARLGAVCGRLAISHPAPHVAAADVAAAAAVLRALWCHLPRLPSFRPCPPFPGAWRLPVPVPPFPRPHRHVPRPGVAKDVANAEL